MSLGGTFAATSVAALPQACRYGTLTHRRFGGGSLDGSEILRPNRRFAGHRGPQLSSHHHAAARRVIRRRTV